MIKAIETHYKGYRFRSRLEARWAVFFDALGLKWEYEVEGFDLGPLGWYLPDFWLPQIQMWAEVKARHHDTTALAKCFAIAAEVGPILLLNGTPENRPYVGITHFDPDNIDDWGCQFFAFTMIHGYPVNEGRLFSCSDGDEAFDDVGWAVNIARAARFEHGVNPSSASSYEKRHDVLIVNQVVFGGSSARTLSWMLQRTEEDVARRIVALQSIIDNLKKRGGIP